MMGRRLLGRKLVCWALRDKGGSLLERGSCRTTQRAWDVSPEVGRFCGPRSDSHQGHLKGKRWAGWHLMDDPKGR